VPASPARRFRNQLVTLRSVLFHAITLLPYRHDERAAAELRADLRRQLLTADIYETALWDTFEVTGPVEIEDDRGQVWFQYRASVTTSNPFETPE
jgi:hypothetical protein